MHIITEKVSEAASSQRHPRRPLAAQPGGVFQPGAGGRLRGISWLAACLPRLASSPGSDEPDGRAGGSCWPLLHTWAEREKHHPGKGAAATSSPATAGARETEICCRGSKGAT